MNLIFRLAKYPGFTLIGIKKQNYLLNRKCLKKGGYY